MNYYFNYLKTWHSTLSKLGFKILFLIHQKALTSKNSCEVAKRVLFTSPFGTGKTYLMKAKAKEILKERKKWNKNGKNFGFLLNEEFRLFSMLIEKPWLLYPHKQFYNKKYINKASIFYLHNRMRRPRSRESFFCCLYSLGFTFTEGFWKGISTLAKWHSDQKFWESMWVDFLHFSILGFLSVAHF